IGGGGVVGRPVRPGGEGDRGARHRSPAGRAPNWRSFTATQRKGNAGWAESAVLANWRSFTAAQRKGNAGWAGSAGLANWRSFTAAQRKGNAGWGPGSAGSAGSGRGAVTAP